MFDYYDFCDMEEIVKNQEKQEDDKYRMQHTHRELKYDTPKFYNFQRKRKKGRK